MSMDIDNSEAVKNLRLTMNNSGVSGSEQEKYFILFGMIYTMIRECERWTKKGIAVEFSKEQSVEEILHQGLCVHNDVVDHVYSGDSEIFALKEDDDHYSLLKFIAGFDDAVRVKFGTLETKEKFLNVDKTLSELSKRKGITKLIIKTMNKMSSKEIRDELYMEEIGVVESQVSDIRTIRRCLFRDD